MAALHLASRAATHSTKVVSRQAITSGPAAPFPARHTSKSVCTPHRSSHSRRSIASAAGSSWLPFIGKQKKQGNNLVLNWARNPVRMACQVAPAKAPAGQDIATFAGGCFWGLELAYQRVPGVTHTSVGYTAGHDKSPTYNSVCSGSTGHAEAVQVYFDPKETGYDKLLDCFFEHVDPTTANRQGNDMGTQYRSGIYYHNKEQKAVAEKAIKDVNEKLQSSMFRRVMGKKVVTELEPASDYYEAEAYHQQYLQKGGNYNRPQNASKGATDKIRCYG